MTLPEGLTDIESRAFVNCENLKTLSLPASLIFINCLNPVFEGCKKLNISVAAGGVFKMTDGMLCGNYWSHNRLVWLQENRTGEVSVPEGITCINSDATTSSPMTKITIPATVTYIQGRNFEDCANLKEVVLRWSEAQLGELIYAKNVATAYFVGAVYTDITVRVPKGTKAAYEAHKLWGMGFNIAEYEVPVSSVTLDKTTLSLQEGASGALKATVNPETASDKTVTWTSSNESVATVDASGNVKAVKAGSATITVTTKDGSKKATCSVTVTPKPVAVESVSLDKTTLSMTEGASGALKATVKPDNASDKSVTWTSSNESVATVDASGNVKAVKAGSATITVTTKDGSKKATCSVTVTPKPVAVESVSLDKTTLSMTEGASGALKATVKPDNATDKSVTWTSSNESVATVGANGNVKAVKAGSATITVTTKDGSKKATCSVTVTAPAAGEVVFEDANFKAALISSGVDANGDGMISESEAEAVTTINVNPYISSITSLGGIEKFINLEILRCYGAYNKLGGLKSLDLSKNTKLEMVFCSYNQLTTLDVSKSTALTQLECGNNKLSALDVSKNTALISLYFFINQLTTLDVSKNLALTILSFDDNQMTTLDVSKNLALTSLSCSSNQLTTLDVSKNLALTSLSCSSNQLTTLDVSKNTVLRSLSCGSNQLTSLDVSKNTALTDLSCRYNQLTTLDVSKNLALTSLNCSYMSTLLTLYMASGQVIDYINGTGDKARSSSYIPDTTTITVK